MNNVRLGYYKKGFAKWACVATFADGRAYVCVADVSKRGDYIIQENTLTEKCVDEKWFADATFIGPFEKQ